MEHRNLRNGLSVLIAALMLLALQPVSAQEDPVRLKINQSLPRARSVSPIPIEIKLEYNRPQILQGDLTLTVYDDRVHRDALRGVVVFEDLTLSGSDLILEGLLPPFGPAWSRQLLVEAEFETTDGDVILLSSTARPGARREPFSLLVDQQTQRTMAAAICTRELAAVKSSSRRFLEKEITPLRFEPPLPGGRQNDGRRLDIVAFPVTPITLSENPAAYCAYDVLMITDQSLGLLKSSHLLAIESWVDAGGSVLVVADGRALPEHLGFLQRLLTDELGSAPILKLNEESRVTILDSDRPMLLAHHGLGRVALITEDGPLEQSLSSQDINQLTAHLWKFRSTQPVFDGQPWEVGVPGGPTATSGHVYEQNGYIYRVNEYGATEVIGQAGGVEGNEQLFLNPHVNELSGVARKVLLPDDVEMIEPWAIALILLVYVVVIGPVDYFVLGWLKLRKFTWIAFPVTTLAFTGFTIWMANSYLGSNDTGQSLTFTDVGRGGKVLRQSTLQMMFYGAETTHEQDVSGALVSQVRSYDGSSLGDPYRSAEAIQLSEPATYAGRYPSVYSLTQRVGQWSPQLLRTLRIAPDDVTLPELPWDDFEQWKSDVGRRRLQDQIRAAFPDDTNVIQAVVMNGPNNWNLIAGPTATHSPNPPQRYRQAQYNLSDLALFETGISLSTVGHRVQFFSVFDQVSPQGSGYLEDLVVFDPADTSQWLLLIAVQAGDEFHVYRRSFREVKPDDAERGQPAG